MATATHEEAVEKEDSTDGGLTSSISAGEILMCLYDTAVCYAENPHDESFDLSTASGLAGIRRTIFVSLERALSLMAPH